MVISTAEFPCNATVRGDNVTALSDGAGQPEVSVFSLQGDSHGAGFNQQLNPIFAVTQVLPQNFDGMLAQQRWCATVFNR